jgi:hypothetical protein
MSTSSPSLLVTKVEVELVIEGGAVIIILEGGDHNSQCTLYSPSPKVISEVRKKHRRGENVKIFLHSVVIVVVLRLCCWILGNCWLWNKLNVVHCL